MGKTKIETPRRSSKFSDVFFRRPTGTAFPPHTNPAATADLQKRAMRSESGEKKMRNFVGNPTRRTVNILRMFPPLLGLMFLLAGCGDSRPAETVRLVTYNAGTFNKYIADDYPLVAEMMREVGADAVCLNELDSCTTRTGGVFQLERIARAMGGWDYRFGRAMPYRGGSYGVGVMTRERILDHFTVALPRGEGAEPRVLTVVELARYVIATTHLDHTSAAAQRDQVAVINRVMRERYAEASKPVFLGGDLNALPDSGTLRALQEAWTVLTPTDGGTYPSHDPKKCIDYILQLDNGVTCETVGARVLHRFEAGDAARASDHLPVLLEIRLPAES